MIEPASWAEGLGEQEGRKNGREESPTDTVGK